MFSVSVIIPTYNEAKNLPPLIEEIFQSINREQIDLEVIIVDDNSPDGTGEVAESLAKRYPIKVLHRASKRGLGSAVIAGFNASNRPYLGVMDADLSHDPAILNDLLGALATSDIAIGSRFEKGSIVEKWVWWRKCLSNVGVHAARLITRTSDPLSGYFFLKREVIDRVALKTVGYKILFEVLVKGHYQSVKEIPFQFRMRRYSSSKLNIREYYLFIKQIIEYAFAGIKGIF